MESNRNSHKEEQLMEYSDRISNWFYKLSDYVEPYLYRVGITPNMVTIFRFILVIGSAYLIRKGHNQIAAPMILGSYFMDCLDGHYARKYKMVSVIGDYLDHGVDVIGFMILFYILFQHLYPNYIWLLALIGMLSATTVMGVTCEEKLKKEIQGEEHVSDSLKIVEFCCNPSYNKILSKDLRTNLKVLRYLGPGTLFLVISGTIFFFHKL